MTESTCNAELACLDALYECLLRERDCLVLYRTEELLENNVLKESLTAELNEARNHRRTLMTDIELKAHPSFKSWAQKNSCVDSLCRDNHHFIERSLKRQSELLDNLRKLMGGPPVYSKQGDFTHSSSSGRVVARRY